jgi:hypothetical protein
LLSSHPDKGKLWQQLLNLDALSSAAQSQPDKHLASISMSSALRSASAHNLALLGQQQQTTASVTGNGPTKKNATGNVSRPEVADRFRQSLENYGRFSFAIHVEYECMMRAVHLPMDSRHYIEVEVGSRQIIVLDRRQNWNQPILGSAQVGRIRVSP